MLEIGKQHQRKGPWVEFFKLAKALALLELPSSPDHGCSLLLTFGRWLGALAPHPSPPAPCPSLLHPVPPSCTLRKTYARVITVYRTENFTTATDFSLLGTGAPSMDFIASLLPSSPCSLLLPALCSLLPRGRLMRMSGQSWPNQGFLGCYLWEEIVTVQWGGGLSLLSFRMAASPFSK